MSIWIKYCVTLLAFFPSQSLFPFPLSSPHLFYPSPFSRSPALLNLLTIPAAFLGKYSPPVLDLITPVFLSLSHHQRILDVNSTTNLVHHMWHCRLTDAEEFFFLMICLSSFSGFWLIMTILLPWINPASALRSSASHAMSAHTACHRRCVYVCVRMYVFNPHLFQWPSDVVLALTHCSRKNRGQDVCII